VSKRLHHWRPGLLAALLALAAQLLFGAVAPDADARPTPDQQLAALLADPGTICHGDVGGGQQTPHHHGIDCLLCPYCAAVIAAAMPRGDGPMLPRPRDGPIAIAIAAPDSVTPPPAPCLAARPRGPPILA
jgi:hypothetical protein